MPLLLRKSYNPNESRDERGRWSAGLKTTTQQASHPTVTKRLFRFIDAHRLDMTGVKLSVSERYNQPGCVRSTIQLPSTRKLGGWDQFLRSFLHEYSHARDYLAGNDDHVDIKEQRARQMERLADSPEGPKQPHEMTHAEFARTVTSRPIMGRQISFMSWADQKGIPRPEFVSEAEYATYIGQSIFPQQRTGATKGKQEALKRRVKRTEELHSQYHAEVPLVQVGSRDLDDTSMDAAYIRAQHKRAIARARTSGQKVPAHILAEYPDLMKSTRPRLILLKSGDHWKEEPRVPKGNEGAGQWTKGATGGSGSQQPGVGAKSGAAAPSPQTGGGMVIRQPVSSEYEVFDQAKKALDEYAEALNRGKGIASQNGADTVDISTVGDSEQRGKMVEEALNGTGDKFIIAPLKSQGRAADKVRNDYGGDWSRIKDIVRGTYLTDSPESARNLLAKMQKSMDVVDVKDKFKKPTDAGYRDMNVVVRLPSGHLAEFQINVRAMLQAKEAAHHLYAEQQSIERKGASATPEDSARLEELLHAQRAIYHPAWEKLGVAKSLRSPRLLLRKAA